MDADTGSARRSSLLTAFSGCALFAAAVLGDASEIAATVEASLAALIAVLGDDLAHVARGASVSERSIRPGLSG